MSLARNIRFWVLLLVFLYSVVLFLTVKVNIPDGSLQVIRLTQLFALSALILLYISLLIGPVTYSFRWLPFRGDIYRVRRAIGVSAFYFSLLHGSFAFFGELGGFAGLFYLPGKYLLAISFSFTALCILTLMAATSFDFMVRKLGKRWKFLHRFIYLAAVLVFVHALLIGSHFQDLSAVIPRVFLGAFALLLLLEANRFDAFLQKKFIGFSRFRLTLILAVGAILAYLVYSF